MNGHMEKWITFTIWDWNSGLYIQILNKDGKKIRRGILKCCLIFLSLSYCLIQFFFLFWRVIILSASKIEIRSRKPTKIASTRNTTAAMKTAVTIAMINVPINTTIAIASPNPVSTIIPPSERLLSASCLDDKHGWLIMTLKSWMSGWHNRSDIEKTLGSGSWICGS